MDIEVIKQLIKAFNEADLTKLDLKCDDFELKLGKEVEIVAGTPITNTVPVQNTVYNSQIEVGTQTTDSEPMNIESQKVIISPIVGTFYTASSPTAKPFVEVGTQVKKGDVVCIIEAMKLMNEVEADVEGEVVEILVGNEEMVEYGQPLFVLK